MQPLGAYGFPPVGNRTTSDRTAPLFPLQGSKAIGLGRDRYKIRSLILDKRNDEKYTVRLIIGSLL